MAATVLGKSVIGEHHPLYLGIYEGAMGRDDVRHYVESSDCVILLGAFMTDINLGIYTARLDPARSIYATSEKLSIRYHTYEEVRFKDFRCAACCACRLRRRELGKIPRPAANHSALRTPHSALSPGLSPSGASSSGSTRSSPTARSSWPTWAMPCLAPRICSSAERTEFISPAYYTSMGFAVPACIGAQLANPKLRPLVLVGDGAFQMTGMELATVARYRLNPVVVVLNNRGYGTERHMQDGPYNDVWPWQYRRLPEILGAGRGLVVETEENWTAR